ncbi:hypothetical protein ACCO45_012326 [Purpureocillium lilacinum]|uniref:Uncharacterized protein n=1 Tax=Purpureocillium lilacinum TaxID=33203 RepID=A0ACC4D8R8_PURLI
MADVVLTSFTGGATGIATAQGLLELAQLFKEMRHASTDIHYFHLETRNLVKVLDMFSRTVEESIPHLDKSQQAARRELVGSTLKLFDFARKEIDSMAKQIGIPIHDAESRFRNSANLFISTTICEDLRRRISELERAQKDVPESLIRKIIRDDGSTVRTEQGTWPQEVMVSHRHGQANDSGNQGDDHTVTGSTSTSTHLERQSLPGNSLRHSRKPPSKEESSNDESPGLRNDVQGDPKIASGAGPREEIKVSGKAFAFRDDNLRRFCGCRRPAVHEETRLAEAPLAPQYHRTRSTSACYQAAAYVPEIEEQTTYINMLWQVTIDVGCMQVDASLRLKRRGLAQNRTKCALWSAQVACISAGSFQLRPAPDNSHVADSPCSQPHIEWVLERWTVNPLAISKDPVFGVLVFNFYRAATRDDVQSQALLACRQFGATLAMGLDTCNLVQEEILPTPSPTTIKLLSVMIGYYKDDAVRALGEDHAGIRFLGLACALVTLSRTHATDALDAMLRSNVENPIDMPRKDYLRRLLDCLEPRCSKSSFAAKVAGYGAVFWQKQLFNHTAQAIGETQETAPSPHAIQILVDVFRELSRVGSAMAYGVEIKVSRSAAWVAAFSEWCLGERPSISLEADDNVEQPVVQFKGSIAKIIIVRDRVGDLKTLVAPETGRGYGGMVSIQTYGEWLGRRNPLPSKLLHQILPHAIALVMSKMEFRNQEAVETCHHPSTSRERRGYVSNRLADLRPLPIPDHAVVKEAYSELLGKDETICIDEKYDRVLLERIPGLRTELEALQAHCDCDNCERSVELSASQRFDASCLRYNLLYRIATLVAEVLGLSLFAFLNGLLLEMGDLHYNTRPQGFVSKIILPILRFGNSNKCDPSDILAWSRAMVGHHNLRNQSGGFNQVSDWILSCQRGQAVFPALFDTWFHINKEGYMSLLSLPGVLQFEETTWDGITGQNSTWGPDQPDGMTPERQVSSPLNLFSESTTSIMVSTTEYRTLKAKLALTTGKAVSPTSRNPMRSLFGLQNGLIADHCGHKRDESTNESQRDCLFVSPEALPSTRLSSGTISVVPVDGADDLRFFSIPAAEETEDRQFVLRKDACLGCSLAVCRKAGISVLIL